MKKLPYYKTEEFKSELANLARSTILMAIGYTLGMIVVTLLFNLK